MDKSVLLRHDDKISLLILHEKNIERLTYLNYFLLNRYSWYIEDANFI